MGGGGGGAIVTESALDLEEVKLKTLINGQTASAILEPFSQPTPDVPSLKRKMALLSEKAFLY